MARKVTYSVIDRPDGRFDLIAVLSSGALYVRRALMTRAEVDENLETLQALMAACGVPVVCKDTRGTH
jgi:hypothetical protein